MVAVQCECGEGPGIEVGQSSAIFKAEKPRGTRLTARTVVKRKLVTYNKTTTTKEKQNSNTSAPESFTPQ